MEFFSLTLISYVTNLFIKHDYLHNFIILFIGIFFFLSNYIFSNKKLKKNKDIKYFLFFLIISIFQFYISKVMMIFHIII